MIFPLDDLVDPALVADLYPVAQSYAQPGEQIIGYPFALSNLLHLAYQPTAVATISDTWDALITNPPGPMVLPAAGRDGALLTLQLYLAAGGSLRNENGQSILQAVPLTEALELLRQGRTNGLISAASNELATRDETWQLFQTGEAVIVRVSPPEV